MRTFYLVVTVLLCLLLQATLSPRIGVGEIAPDFIILAIIVAGLHRGAIYGAIVGFVVGFIQDVGNPDMLGLNALTKTLLGFMMGRAGEKMDTGNVLFLFGVFAAGGLGHDALYLLFYKWPHVGGALLKVLTVALPSAIYTAILGVGIDRVAVRFGAKAVALGKTGH